MTVERFLAIEDEGEILKIKAIKDSIKGRNYIGKYKSKEFIDMSYAKVQTIKDYYQDGNILYLVSATCDMGHKELLKSDYVDLIYYLKFIDEQFEIISMLEGNLNKKNSDEELDQMNLESCGADYEQLGKIGTINIIDSLAGDDMLKWEQIERQPYKKVYVKLLRSKLTARIQRAVAKMKTPKE